MSDIELLAEFARGEWPVRRIVEEIVRLREALEQLDEMSGELPGVANDIIDRALEGRDE